MTNRARPSQIDAIVAAEIHVERTPDGRLWVPNCFPPQFWGSYKTVFGEVWLLARVAERATPSRGWIDSEDCGVGVLGIPDFVGPEQLLFGLRTILPPLLAACRRDCAFILRAPGMIAEMCAAYLHLNGRPFALEVVGDPADSLAVGSLRSSLRGVYRFVSTNNLRWMCRKAIAVSYVNSTALPLRYPAGSNTYATNYSSIVLDDRWFVSKESISVRDYGPYRILTIGTLDQAYKGIDVLLKSAAKCLSDGLDLQLDIVGDGRLRESYEALAKELGMGSRAKFLGYLGTDDIIRAIDDCDLFVLASRQEGLARALIEVMARGKPAITSAVGGLPELVSEHCLAPPNDHIALARVMGAVLQDPRRRLHVAEGNLIRAREFAWASLKPRRQKLYELVREQTHANQQSL